MFSRRLIRSFLPLSLLLLLACSDDLARPFDWASVVRFTR